LASRLKSIYFLVGGFIYPGVFGIIPTIYANFMPQKNTAGIPRVLLLAIWKRPGSGNGDNYGRYE
jgi:hypothetical protein